MRTCSVEGCGRKHEARGFCSPHYSRWKSKNRRTAIREAKHPILEMPLPPFTGLCSTHPDPSLWENFRDDRETAEQREARHHKAVTVCSQCPSRHACAMFAYLHGEEGIWGGHLFGTVRREAPGDRYVVDAVSSGLLPWDEASPQEKRTVIRDLHSTGMSDPDIATRIGISPDAVCAMRRRMGLPGNGPHAKVSA